MMDRAVSAFLWLCAIGVWTTCLAVVIGPWIIGALWIFGGLP